jgi:hypothetical protein
MARQPSMSTSDASSSELLPDAHLNSEQGTPKSFSCVLCSQRKVKCDRRFTGCANCAKSRVPCIYKAPPPPRRRKKGVREGVREVDTVTRIRIYEDALRQHGVEPESLVTQEISKSRVERETAGLNSFLEQPIPIAPEGGVLISEKGRSRYLDNGIWTSLQSEFRDTKELLEESSDEESTEENNRLVHDQIPSRESSLLFGSPRLSLSLHSLHADPLQTHKLWQLYLDNINPLVKVFHAPTVQQHITDVVGNMDTIPRNLEALLFSINCITVESMDDGQCLAIMGQSKTRTLQRFRTGAQQALLNANLLRSSDLMVLQAFSLFIMSLQGFDARVIWIWSGIAQRIGQRIGLHRDGAKLGLPPFEVEIRRRLWWQIMMLEGYAQKLAGTGSAGLILQGDVAMPSNLNDSDLFVGMKELPKEHEGATEMMFFLIRCHVGDFLKRAANAHTTFDGVWHRLTSKAIHVEIKDQGTAELEELFQRKFLRYCDPSIPWHLMCSTLASTVIFMMRFISHSTEYSSGGLSQVAKDKLFDIALIVVGAQNLAYTMKEMRPFMWHVNLHFQWKAFVFVLSELRYRTDGPQVDHAWKEIGKSYDFHPSFHAELIKKALPIAVSNLTLKAWEAYINAGGVPQSGEPSFIQLIRRRQSPVALSLETRQQHDNYTPQPSSADAVEGDIHRLNNRNVPTSDPLQGFDWDAPDSAGLDMMNDTLLGLPETINWEAWDNLVVDYSTEGFANYDMEIDLPSLDFAHS